MELTTPELEGLSVLAQWSFLNAGIATVVYRWLFGRWFWMDGKQLWDDVKFIVQHFVNPPEVEPVERSRNRKYNPDDYWEEEVDFATGEIGSNSGSSIRHPKNVDRAYSGGAERFHDGGG